MKMLHGLVSWKLIYEICSIDSISVKWQCSSNIK